MAVSARHDDTGPSETHGHFHAAAAGAGPRPRPSLTAAEQPWPGAGGWRGWAADGRVARGPGQATPRSYSAHMPGLVPSPRGFASPLPAAPAAPATCSASRALGGGGPSLAALSSGSRSGGGGGDGGEGKEGGTERGEGGAGTHNTAHVRREAVAPGERRSAPGTPAAGAGLRVLQPLASLARGGLRSPHPQPSSEIPAPRPRVSPEQPPLFLCRF